MSPEERTDAFILAEYHEAANAYFKGVDIGYTTVKGYVTVNGLFAAVIGALADKATVVPAGAEMIRLIPGFAIAASLALFVLLPHYFRHLENCRLRCEQIEKHWGGRLFTRLGEIAHGRRNINSMIGLISIIVIILSFWVYFAIKLQNPDFKVLPWLMSLASLIR